MKLREKLALVLLIAIGCFFCGHSEYRGAIAQHDVSACLVPCAGAAAVIVATVPERGQMCRCWAENAFSYTFSYPASTEDVDYARRRWDSGLKAAEQCRRQGFGWGTDQAGDNVICLKPQSYEPRKVDPLQHTSLGRLHPDDWPRFVVLPAWMQWHVRRKTT